MTILRIGVARTGSHLKRHFHFSFIFGSGVFLVTYILISCSQPTIAREGFNKLFTHNRTTNPFDDSDSSFLTRLRDLTAAAKKSNSGQPNQWTGTNGRPKIKGTNKQPQFEPTTKGNGGKNKKNKGNGGNGNGRKPKPSSNYNANHNYYSSSYAIPKYRIDGSTVATVFTPTVPPTRIHPLAVLKTEIKVPGKPPGQSDGVINYGRSALDDLLAADQNDQEGRSSESLKGPAADTNFFVNFKDHAEDPMAEESGSPAPAYARPDEQRHTINPTSASSAPSGQGNIQFRHPINGQYSELYPVEYSHGGGQAHPDQKNINYWPQKLNSYYGDDYLNQFHFNKKRPRYPQSHHVNSFDEYGDEAAASTNALQKVTMIDRISTFYTDYKLLAWIGIVVLASLAALIGLLVLYWRNPPTEVVTARSDLVRKLADPTLLIFVSEALRKFGEKEKVDEKPGGQKRLKRRRPKND